MLHCCHELCVTYTRTCTAAAAVQQLPAMWWPPIYIATCTAGVTSLVTAARKNFFVGGCRLARLRQRMVGCRQRVAAAHHAYSGKIFGLMSSIAIMGTRLPAVLKHPCRFHAVWNVLGNGPPVHAMDCSMSSMQTVAGH